MSSDKEFEQLMDCREFVLKTYLNAYAVEVGGGHYDIYIPAHCEAGLRLIGEGENENDAWADAAKQISERHD